MSDFSTLSPSCFSSLSLWFFGLLSLSSNPKPIFSNPKSRVVVAAAEVGVGMGCHQWWWHRIPSSSPSSSSSLFLWSLIPFFLSHLFFLFFSLSSLESTLHGGDVAWDSWIGGWVSSSLMWVSFFGGMGFMDQWMSFIFGGVGGRISLFLGLVVVIFVGWWWVIWWWCG